MTNPTIVLLTGVSGCGKTAISTQLRRDGHEAVSLDGHPGLCSWTDHQGHRVVRPNEPTLDWLQQHCWCWDPDVLTALIAAKRGGSCAVVWMVGVAVNTAEHAHLFDRRILMRVTEQVMLQRIQHPDRSSDFGRTGDSPHLLRQRFRRDQHELAAICDSVVDATLPLPEVARDLRLSLTDEPSSRQEATTLPAARRRAYHKMARSHRHSARASAAAALRVTSTGTATRSR